MKNVTVSKIEALQIEVNKMATLWTAEIYSICETMDYKNSSLFSYNIDRMKHFVDFLNETNLK